jgi:hypothetical protein
MEVSVSFDVSLRLDLFLSLENPPTPSTKTHLWYSKFPIALILIIKVGSRKVPLSQRNMSIGPTPD